MTEFKTILEEAGHLVDGERESTYGHPMDDFSAVTLAADALGIQPGGQLELGNDALHHALYMVLVKIQRLVQTPNHHDSIVDGAGYFRTYEKILERMKPPEEQYPIAKLDDGKIVKYVDNKWVEVSDE